jgi:isopropylmalate/homocitrate/citramalate synthase
MPPRNTGQLAYMSTSLFLATTQRALAQKTKTNDSKNKKDTYKKTDPEKIQDALDTVKELYDKTYKKGISVKELVKIQVTFASQRHHQ